MKKLFINIFLISLAAQLPYMQASAVVLDEHCIVNILNRTIQVSDKGGWALPNVPSNMGRVKARATCTLDDGTTVSGQSDYFAMTTNAITNVGAIKFEGIEAIPSEINFSPATPISLDAVGKSAPLKVLAKYKNAADKEVSGSAFGVNYSSTNQAVATVSAEGVVTAVGNGNVLINARKDGVLASIKVSVITSGDLDKDGMPDAWEVANGLNPADPVDAEEDKDGDKLSNLEEFTEGTNPALADSDKDGLSDYREIKELITSPLLADTDGDGLNDNVELLVNTDPKSAASVNYAAAVQSISVTPPNVVLTFSGVDTEVSTQLTVTAKLVDGSLLDITQKSFGTTYASDNLKVVSFGIEDGKLYGGESGKAIVSIKNGNHTVPLAIVVDTFVPSVLSAVAIPGYANNVDISGDIAYVAAGNSGLQVVDVSNRKDPKIIGSLDTDGIAIDVRVRGNQVFLADGEAGLKIIDITLPAAPKLLAALDTAGITQDLQVSGRFAYLANGTAGIDIIDIADIAAPVALGSMSNLGNVKGLDVEGNLLVVGTDSTLLTIDVTDKYSPAKMGSINIGQIKDLVVNNGYAHVAAYSSGYRVVNLKNPALPVITGGKADIAPRDVELTEGLAFYAEQLFPNVVAYVNIEDAEKPVFQGTIDLSKFGDYAGTGIALDATHAYITEESYVVSSDYQASGNTKLFIAQYRMLNDTAGIEPLVLLENPKQGNVYVEDKSILLEASAGDDVAVKEVEFFVDDVSVGKDTTRPYVVPFKIPAGKRFVNIMAKATDLGGNSAVTETTRINIQPDKDKDDLGNDEEANVYLTDPANPDTDSDGLMDGLEIALNTKPLIKDSDNDGLIDGEEVKNGTDPLNPDVTKPTVVSTTPAEGLIDVPENAAVIIKFNEPLLAKSIKQGVVVLKQQGTLAIDGSVQLAPNGMEVIFTPTDLLKDYTAHQITVSGVKDLAGNPLAQPFILNYTTGNTVDTVKPTVQNITPQNNALDVPVNSLLTLVMSEPVDPKTVTEANFTVRDTVDNAIIPGALSISDDKRSLSFIPNRAFLVGRRHQVYIKDVKDLFGNVMNNAYFYFTTAFKSDGEAPVLLASTLSRAKTNIPVNVTLRTLFNEALNGLSINQVHLQKAGVDVPAEISLDTNNTRIQLKPIAPLESNAAYELIIEQVADLSGNLLANSQTITFSTSANSDTTAGTISAYSPQSNATLVPVDAAIELTLNERVDPATVLENTFRLYDNTEARYLPGKIEVSLDGLNLKLIPTQPLKAAHQFTVYASYNEQFWDLTANNFGSRAWSFKTGSAPDTTAPVVEQFNVGANAVGVPVNPIIRFVMDEHVNRLCVNTSSVKLMRKSDGVIIEGTVVVETGDHAVTFTPKANLAVSTDYELVLDGICDLSGNKMLLVKQGFTTSADATADKTRPALTSQTPAQAVTGVASKAAITFTFNEVIDATSLDRLQIVANNIAGQIAGSWTAQGNQLMFTPLNDYPSDTRITVYLYGLLDLAGNELSSSTYFQSAPATDTTAPQVVVMTPGNGAMDIGPQTSIALTFSESLRQNTLNSNNFVLYVEGDIIRPSVSYTADNRTVILNTPLPSAKSVSVIVTSDVMDNAGNRLLDYAATFNTALINNDVTRPSIQQQSPVSAANNVIQLNHVTLYANEKLNAATVSQNIYAAVNGVLVPGTSALDDSQQAIIFTPAQAFPDYALVEIFATNDIQDVSGNALNNYRGSFTTGSLLGSKKEAKPVVQAYYPTNGGSDINLNPIIEVLFDQALAPASVVAENIQLRLDYSGAIQPSELILSADGRRVRIKPLSPLAANVTYYIRLYKGLQDIDGDALANDTYGYFKTGAAAVEDTQAPVVQRVSPANGTENVPVNAAFHWRFDEAIHPLSMTAKNRDLMTFLEGGREVRYVKDKPMAIKADIEEKLTGVTDKSGNGLPEFSLKFKTSGDTDYTAPKIVRTSLTSGVIDVPLNTIFKFEVDEPINPLSLLSNYLYLRDNVTGTNVATTLDISGDGRTVSLVPQAALLPSRSYSVYFYYPKDLADNQGNTAAYSFTTGLEQDILPPSVVVTSIEDGQLEVPMNARLRIRFNQWINIHSIQGVKITLDGVGIVSDSELTIDRSLLTLTPKQLLKPKTAYRLEIEGVQDVSGNVLPAAVTKIFTTASKIDTITGVISGQTPASGAVDVPLNAVIELTLNERVDATTVLENTFRLYDNTEARYLPGKIEVSLDGLSLKLIPTQPLKAAHQYTVYASYNEQFYDLTVNAFGAKAWSFKTILQ